MSKIGVTRPASGLYIWLQHTHLEALRLRPSIKSVDPTTYEHFTFRWSDTYRTITLERTADGPSILRSHGGAGRGWSPSQQWPYRICFTKPNRLLKRYTHQHGMALCDWSMDGDDIVLHVPEAQTLPRPNVQRARRNYRVTTPWSAPVQPASLVMPADVIRTKPEDDVDRMHSLI